MWLIRNTVADLCLFRWALNQLLNVLPLLSKPLVELWKPDLHLLRRDVVALDNGDLFDRCFSGSSNDLSHKFQCWVYQLDEPSVVAGLFRVWEASGKAVAIFQR